MYEMNIYQKAIKSALVGSTPEFRTDVLYYLVENERDIDILSRVYAYIKIKNSPVTLNSPNNGTSS